MNRTWMVAGLLVLAGCGREPAPDEGQSGLPAVVSAEPGKAAAKATPAARTIACVPPGEGEFRDVCAIDRVTDARGTVLTIRLPDGGFRRLRVSEDGRTVTAADGSEVAAVRAGGGAIEVAIGGARFRLPAKAGTDAPG